MEKETEHSILNLEHNSNQTIPMPSPIKPRKQPTIAQSTQLISFEFHNDVLKRVINQLTQKAKNQQNYSQSIQSSLQQLRNDFSVMKQELKRLEERRQMKEVEIENKFRRREEVEFGLRHDINMKHQFVKSQLSQMNFTELRHQVKEFVQKKKAETLKEIQTIIQAESQKLRVALQSKMYEDTSTMIIEATNKIQQRVQMQTAAIKQLKKQTSLQSKIQQKKLDEFLKQSTKYLEKNDEKFITFKEDIMENVPTMMFSMLQNKREEDDGKFKQLIAQHQIKRQVKETLIEQKIDEVEQKEKRLEELLKQFEIQIQLLGSNVVAGSIGSRNPSERRGSKLTPMNTNNINYAKKMSYDVMIEKIFLVQEQLANNGRAHQALKQKVSALETQLHSNPILSNLAQNPYIKKLLDDMLQKSLRSIQSRIVDKLDSQTHYKDLKLYTQRLDLLTLSVIDKCEKQEVKKALRFLEEKIKDVIILASGAAAEQGKDPFIEKKQIFKCLSCDKAVEKERDFAKTATTQYRVWKKIAKENMNTERVNQLGLGNTSSIRRLMRTGTAKNTQRVKIICNN